jgi:hypothetical protein
MALCVRVVVAVPQATPEKDRHGDESSWAVIGQPTVHKSVPRCVAMAADRADLESYAWHSKETGARLRAVSATAGMPPPPHISATLSAPPARFDTAALQARVTGSPGDRQLTLAGQTRRDVSLHTRLPPPAVPSARCTCAAPQESFCSLVETYWASANPPQAGWQAKAR